MAMNQNLSLQAPCTSQLKALELELISTFWIRFLYLGMDYNFNAEHLWISVNIKYCGLGLCLKEKILTDQNEQG